MRLLDGCLVTVALDADRDATTDLHADHGLPVFFSFGPLVILAWMGTVLIHRFGTPLSEEGISFITLRGRVFVPWSEIERAQSRRQELYLWSATHHMAINMYCYVEPERVPPFVRCHLPTHILCQLDSQGC